MKKITLLFFTCSVILIISAFTVLQHPTGELYHTGSPYDGSHHCSHCHSGGTPTPTVTITTNPAFDIGNTYIPGTTYTINVTGTGSYPKYGFGLEILNSNTTTAKDAGTFGAVVTPNCKKVPHATKPTNIVHTAPTGSSNTATFSFTWTAPGSGTAYLYCALNAVNNNNATTGDKTVATSLILTQSTTGIASIGERVSNVSIFPNPASEYANVSYTLKENSDVTIELYDISGKNVSNWHMENQQAGKHNQAINLSELNLKSGIYSATIKAGNSSIAKRLIIN